MTLRATPLVRGNEFLEKPMRTALADRRSVGEFVAVAEVAGVAETGDDVGFFVEHGVNGGESRA